MQDIVIHELVPLEPYEFLGVSKAARMAAIEILLQERIPCTDRHYYYVIHVLACTNRFADIASFTENNWTGETDIVDAIKHGVLQERDFKYLKYYTDLHYIKRIMVYRASRSIFNIDMNLVIDIIGEQYLTDPEYEDLIAPDIFDLSQPKGSRFINHDINTEWNDHYARQSLRFAIRHDPGGVVESIAADIGDLYNNNIMDNANNNINNDDDDNEELRYRPFIWNRVSTEYLQLLINEADALLDDAMKHKLNLYLWHHRMFDVGHELREEMYVKASNEKPVFKIPRDQISIDWRRLQCIRRLLSMQDDDNNDLRITTISHNKYLWIITQ